MSDWSSDVCSSDLRVSALRCLRIAEIRRGSRLALALPVAEIAFDQRCHQARIGIARHHDHGIFGPVPALMECLHRLAGCGLKRFLGPDRQARGEPLSGKQGLAGQIVYTLRSSEEHTSELQSLMRSSYAVFCTINKDEGRSTKSRRAHERN